MLFKEYKFKQETIDFIELNGFTQPTPIQQKTIKEILNNKDVVGISKTGTGKTHAFLIPMMEKVDSNLDQVQAIISSPTRELAMQIYNRAKLMAKACPNLRIKLITGGIDRDKMAESIKKQPHIVIGTPGRIKDLFINQNVLKVQQAKMFIVDEADMTLEFGFLEDIDSMVSKMSNNLQMVCFSATIPNGLKPFFKKYLNNPTIIKVDDSLDVNPNIDHILINCKHKSYENMLVDLIDGINPYVCLIFANTREQATITAKKLRENGLNVLEMHGGLDARKRAQSLKRLNSLEHTYIVASDVAARGIDIDSISHVISLGFPKEVKFYIHRAGRSSRAGKHGICYALYKAEDDSAIKTLIKQGIDFQHTAYKNHVFTKLNPYQQKRSYKTDLREKEIAQSLTRKKEKVKPGYKKKKAAQVQKIKQREKQIMIRQQIKEVRKQKYKESAIREKLNKD